VQLARVQRRVADLLALRDDVDRLDRQKILDEPTVAVLSAHAWASIASAGTR
jgi:hypothetical protein